MWSSSNTTLVSVWVMNMWSLIVTLNSNIKQTKRGLTTPNKILQESEEMLKLTLISINLSWDIENNLVFVRLLTIIWKQSDSWSIKFNTIDKVVLSDFHFLVLVSLISYLWVLTEHSNSLLINKIEQRWQKHSQPSITKRLKLTSCDLLNVSLTFSDESSLYAMGCSQGKERIESCSPPLVRNQRFLPNSQWITQLSYGHMGDFEWRYFFNCTFS